MKTTFLLFCILVGTMVSVTATAQVDPSTAVLLRSGRRIQTKGEVESDRYSIRPGSSTKTAETNVQVQQSVNQNSDGQQSVKQSSQVEISDSDRRQPSKSDVKAVQKIEITQPEEVVATPVEEPSVEKKSEAGDAEAEKKTLIQDLREIFLGGSPKEVDEYLGKVEATDPRNNVVEFTVAPMLFYNDSNSNYWYRDYFSYGPGLNLNAKLWFSPFFGLSATYQTVFNSEVYNSPAGDTTEPVDHNGFGAELLFRSYFGVTQRAPSLTFGLGFGEYQMKAKAASTSRIGVKTSGVKLTLESMIPVTRGTAWTMGLELTPRATHQESKTQISPRSGKHDETNVIGFSLGKKYTFNRSQVLFWKLQHQFEKNAFKNTATVADPTGRQPSDVSVTNTRSMFLFGFTWGN